MAGFEINSYKGENYVGETNMIWQLTSGQRRSSMEPE